jgi:pimeloyl-ACP methyl ester carboxylesterase
MADAEVKQMTAMRPDVQHTVIADASHDVHLEQHEALMHVLETFLRHR